LIRSASSEPTRFSSRPGRLHEAKRGLEEELAVERAANASDEANRQRGGMRDGRRTSARLKPYTPPDPPADNVSITDPDSRLVRGMRRWIEGYNAQAAGNERDLILAAEAMTTSADFGHLRPMLTAARSELAAASVTEGPKVVVADADHWHLEQMNEITGQRIPVLIPPDSSQKEHPAGLARRRLRLHARGAQHRPRHRALQAPRAQLIEPIFGNTKRNRGFTRFARRGRSAARTEWRLMATTHDLLKLHQQFTPPRRTDRGARRAATTRGAAPHRQPRPLRDSRGTGSAAGKKRRCLARIRESALISGYSR